MKNKIKHFPVCSILLIVSLLCGCSARNAVTKMLPENEEAAETEEIVTEESLSDNISGTDTEEQPDILKETSEPETETVAEITEEVEEEVITDEMLLEEVQVYFDTDRLEYSDKDTDILQLIHADHPEVKISTSDNVNLSQTGKQEVLYLLTLGEAEKTISHVFNIEDTKGAVIDIKTDSLQVEYGDSFNPIDNIAEVYDVVDGNLEYIDHEPESYENGWYTIEGDYDTRKSGYYDLAVIACDNHGNRTKKEFHLTVNEEIVPDVPSEPVFDYIGNANTKKFHYPDCKSVKKMKESNKVYYYDVTRDDMISMGYVPCKNCNP